MEEQFLVAGIGAGLGVQPDMGLPLSAVSAVISCREQTRVSSQLHQTM